MRISFDQHLQRKARAEGGTLYMLCRRQLAKNPKNDQVLIASGITDDENDAVIEAVLTWLIKRDAAALKLLKKVVLALH